MRSNVNRAALVGVIAVGLATAFDRIGFAGRTQEGRAEEDVLRLGPSGPVSVPDPAPATPLPVPSPDETNGSVSGPSAPPTTTTPPATTEPPAPAPAPPPSPAPGPAGAPAPSVSPGPLGGSSGDIGCNLIGDGAVGLVTAGETPTQAVAVKDVVSFLGVPYVWGGESNQGFDCSGLVQAVYHEAGVNLPRVAQDQYDAGPTVNPGQAVVPGDLVFFGTGPGDVSHVGMFVGDGLMVDAPHSGATVRFDRVDGFGSIVGITSPGGTSTS